MADRNRDKVRASLNWQANEQFALQGGVSYDQDKYKNSVYGLQDAKNWAFNLDGTYTANDNLSVTVFYTYEDQRSKSAGNTYTANSTSTNVGTANYTAVVGSPCFTDIATRNASNKLDACLNWSADMRDKVDTLGLSLKKKGLMAGKLELVGDVVFTRARTDNNVSGGNYANNPAAVANAAGAAGSTAAYYLAATALPTVTTNTTELKLSGQYTIDKSAAVRVGYTYQHMKAVDWAYDGMQVGGGLTGVLPTNEQAPNYTVHVVGVSYLYTFR
jgi:hypothetical protein